MRTVPSAPLLLLPPFLAPVLQMEGSQFEAQYGEGSDYHDDAEEGYR